MFILIFVLSSFTAFSQVEGKWNVSEIEYNWEEIFKSDPSLEVEGNALYLLEESFNLFVSFTDVTFFENGQLLIDTPIQDITGSWYKYANDVYKVTFRYNGDYFSINLKLVGNYLFIVDGYSIGYRKYERFVSNKPFLWRPIST